MVTNFNIVLKIQVILMHAILPKFPLKIVSKPQDIVLEIVLSVAKCR